ncbi:hypothetical protein BB559_000607 [Furculomyces boomerangus]|uniref:Uncharacterized protein n=2 Tax=Harpellales TaxID=61421 RepID=A0A2T9Z4N1_9FUNG|nr:hypothetical protein BB559_000607 [Furculomyces boomerangus]PVZ99387.1 hypothetical protein BB558_004592 [Smittium angustum]
MDELNQRLNRLQKIVIGEHGIGPQNTTNISQEAFELQKKVNEIYNREFLLSEFIKKYYRAKKLIDDPYSISREFVTSEQKAENLSSLQDDIFQIANSSVKVQKASKLLDSDVFSRAAELENKVKNATNETIQLKGSVNETERKVVELVSRYHTEISAISEIFLKLEAHIKQMERKVMQLENKN